MAYGKSIELFLVNGTAESLVTAELSNWNGKAIKIPRIEVASCNREDIKGAGVYFLFCREDDGQGAVYIGESETVQDRLIQHIRDYVSDKEKFYWTTAVIFLGRDLNKALIRYLEDRLVQIAREKKRCIVLTKNTYSKTVMKESQVAAMEEFIDNVRILISALGYNVLESAAKDDKGTSQDDRLYLQIGGANATGQVTTEGFVVLAGSIINEKASEKSLSKGMFALRKKHFDAGRVVNLKTTEDIVFSSSSAAADFVIGYSVSGPANWKNSSGKSLKEIEEEETKNV